MLVYVPVQWYLYKMYFGYAANAYYLMTFVLCISSILRPNVMICCQSRAWQQNLQHKQATLFPHRVCFMHILLFSTGERIACQSLLSIWP